MVLDSQRLARLLHVLQDTRSCHGFEELAQRNHVRDRRTVYRWRRALGSSLRIIPSFALQRLGLSHLHLVITNPGKQWLRFPYAVEHAWVTQDFVTERLYLHCVAPIAHKSLIRDLVRECQGSGWCTGFTVAWSGTPWQEVPEATTGTPPPDIAAPVNVGLLRACPLIIPTICESWDQPQSLARIWDAVTLRVGDRLRSYVPRGRIYHANGKAHVRQALARLSDHGLFRQYLVRYQGWVAEYLEVFVFLRHASDWLPELIEALRPIAAMIETAAGEDGSVVVRVAGHDAVLRYVLGCRDDLRRHGASIFVRTNPGATEHVRFCYESLFDPNTGDWVFPHDAVIEHMRGDQ